MTVKGSCHCGATRFELDFTPRSATRCTCTFCTKRGALWVYAYPSQFRLTAGIEANAVYSPTNPQNQHFFCSTCGCTTFSECPDYATGPFDPNRRRISVSAHLLDDFDIAGLETEVVDGRNLW